VRIDSVSELSSDSSSSSSSSDDEKHLAPDFLPEAVWDFSLPDSFRLPGEPPEAPEPAQ
jgi:hypothetical protein